jgi:hypothetical protein
MWSHLYYSLKIRIKRLKSNIELEYSCSLTLLDCPEVKKRWVKRSVEIIDWFDQFDHSKTHSSSYSILINKQNSNQRNSFSIICCCFFQYKTFQTNSATSIEKSIFSNKIISIDIVFIRNHTLHYIINHFWWTRLFSYSSFYSPLQKVILIKNKISWNQLFEYRWKLWITTI